MHIILREFDRLDDASRQEVLTVLDRRYRHPVDDPRPQAERPTTAPPKTSPLPNSKGGGRPFSDNTRRILESLEKEGPGTPAVVTQRTGIPNTKQTLKRLEERGHVRKEARGFYQFVSHPM
jgi:hypothetical protein